MFDCRIWVMKPEPGGKALVLKIVALCFEKVSSGECLMPGQDLDGAQWRIHINEFIALVLDLL